MTIDLNVKKIDRIALIIVLTVSLAGGYYAAHQIMKKGEQFQIEKDIFSRRTKEVDLATTNLEDLKSTLDQTKRELMFLNERIPKSDKIGVLLNQIDALMNQRKISLIRLAPLSTVQEKIYIRNPIRLTFKGDFANICHLIHDLERMNRIIVIEKITITKDDIPEKCRVDLMTSVFQR